MIKKIKYYINFFSVMGLVLLITGLYGLFLRQHEYFPSFLGRWGWLYKIIYNILGVNGEFYIFILGGIYFVYYSVFKLKK